MPAIVQLNELVDGLESQIDEYSSFLDLDTGHVECISNDLLGRAERGEEDDDPDRPEWEQQEWEVAKRIVSTDRFRRIPSKFDIHEWEIMREFSETLESDRIREDLLRAIHGAGAFRHFKSSVRFHRIEQAWFDFRGKALRQIAIDWCEEIGVAWK